MSWLRNTMRLSSKGVCLYSKQILAWSLCSPCSPSSRTIKAIILSSSVVACSLCSPLSLATRAITLSRIRPSPRCQVTLGSPALPGSCRNTAFPQKTLPIVQSESRSFQQLQQSRFALTPSDRAVPTFWGLAWPRLPHFLLSAIILGPSLACLLPTLFASFIVCLFVELVYAFVFSIWEELEAPIDLLPMYERTAHCWVK